MTENLELTKYKLQRFNINDPIKVLDFGRAVHDCVAKSLEYCGVHTVGELLNHIHLGKLQQMPYLGKKKLECLCNAMDDYSERLDAYVASERLTAAQEYTTGIRNTHILSKFIAQHSGYARTLKSCIQ